jgi:Cu2+-containing amine oxidase
VFGHGCVTVRTCCVTRPLWARVLDCFGPRRGMGTSSRELAAGSDCPENAMYVDTPLYSGSTFTNRRSICIFEHSTGVPLRRHDDVTIDSYGGLMATSLVVRGIAAVRAPVGARDCASSA